MLPTTEEEARAKKQQSREEYLKEIERRFTYQAPSSDGVRRAHEMVGHVTGLVAHVLARYLPKSRELSQAISSLELCRMQANQAIALSQCEVTSRELSHVTMWIHGHVRGEAEATLVEPPPADDPAPSPGDAGI